MTPTVLVTELHGRVSVDDVARWTQRLHADVAALPAGARFRLVHDLVGYEPADLGAHKAMREVVPLVLAQHGLRPAVADLFPELPPPEVTIDRDVVATACATVHHDPDKMSRYEELIATPTQRFFTDRRAADAWIASLGA